MHLKLLIVVCFMYDVLLIFILLYFLRRLCWVYKEDNEDDATQVQNGEQGGGGTKATRRI